MSEIKIKCPKCGKILRLADNPKINNAVFTCPVCKEKSKVSVCLRMIDAPIQNITSEETQYFFPTSKDNGEETEISGMQSMPQMVGALIDANGKTYRLNLGVSTIGRKAMASIAALQIETNDLYMSRNHAIIEVKDIGTHTITIIRHGAGKNPSYLNGKLLEAGDQLVLNDGDIIRLGMTEITFKK